MGVTPVSEETVLIAQVLIDSVGLSKEFTYLVPDKLEEKVAIGNFVSVPLGNVRSRGWIVGLKIVNRGELNESEFKILPIYRVLGGGPSREVLALSKWAAWRFIGSPVSFLTHASPKKRIQPSKTDRSEFEFSFNLSAESLKSNLNRLEVMRIPPTHSRLDWLVAHLASLEQKSDKVLVVCPTQRMVEHFSSSFRDLGYSVATFPDQFVECRDSAQLIFGARSAVFATVENLAEIIVVDSDEPSHRESAAPYWDSSEVARARSRTGCKAVILSSAPSLQICHGAKVYGLTRSSERAGWPKVLVADLGDPGHQGSLISPALLSQIKTGLNHTGRPIESLNSGLLHFNGILVLYNRLGGARTLICSKCANPVSCVNCATTLMQISPVLRESSGAERTSDPYRRAKETVSVTDLICPKCKTRYPAICTNCLSGSLKVVTFGIKRFSALLEAALKTRVSEVDASSKELSSDLAPIVVGTEAIFSRFLSAAMVVIADFDHYLFMPSLDAQEKALSLLARASRLLPPRSQVSDYVPLYIQTRDPDNVVIKAVIEADPRKVLSDEMALRKRLNLPPYGAIARVSGPSAAAWIEKSEIALNPDIQIVPIADQSFDLRASSHKVLLDLVEDARLKVSSRAVRFEADPG